MSKFYVVPLELVKDNPCVGTVTCETKERAVSEALKMARAKRGHTNCKDWAVVQIVGVAGPVDNVSYKDEE